jgi:hypothetical protein
MATNGNESDELTPRQRRTIAALLSSRSVPDAAQAAHVGARTLYRWLTEPKFRAALVDAEGGAIDQATRRLIGMQDGAIDLLADVMQDMKVNTAVRLRAAQNVLDYLLKLRELRNVEGRLAALEEMVYGRKQAIR